MWYKYQLVQHKQISMWAEWEYAGEGRGKEVLRMTMRDSSMRTLLKYSNVIIVLLHSLTADVSQSFKVLLNTPTTPQGQSCGKGGVWNIIYEGSNFNPMLKATGGETPTGRFQHWEACLTNLFQYFVEIESWN